MRVTALALCILAGVSGELAAASPTVGIEGRLEVSLPVTGLRARAPERDAPVTVRIASATSTENTTRYDLRYIGLVPGKHDLRAYLLHADGSPANEFPPLEVQVDGVLPPDKQGLLIAIPEVGFSAGGGYRWVMAGAAVVWLLAAIPVFRRRRLAASTAAGKEPVTLTLPDRLRLLVQQAAAGELDVTGQAALERMVLGHWSEELGLQALSPGEAFARLRAHPQAALLLRTLEDWLHRPPTARAASLEALLAAYGRPRQEPQEAGVR